MKLSLRTEKHLNFDLGMVFVFCFCIICGNCYFQINLFVLSGNHYVNVLVLCYVLLPNYFDFN